MRLQATALALLLCLPFFASSQEYPVRPITIVVPFGPGGPTDLLARIVANKMSASLKQQTLVENVLGAGGSIGASRVAKAKPDGYTLLMGNSGTHVLAVGLSSKLPYDPRKDFAPIGLVASDYILLIAKKEFPPITLKEFITHVRENRSRTSYSSAGTGSVSHVACAFLSHLIGVELTHVPYKGAMQAMQDVIRGEIDFSCSLSGISRAFIENGSIKGIAVGGPVRSPLLPNVPTSVESGLPAFQVQSWNALFAPAGLPAAIATRLNQPVREAFQDPELQKRFGQLGAILPRPDEQSPEALGRLVDADLTKWLPLMKTLALPRD